MALRLRMLLLASYRTTSDSDSMGGRSLVLRMTREHSGGWEGAEGQADQGEEIKQQVDRVRASMQWEQLV